MQFLGKLNQNGTEKYSFETNKCLPAIEELGEFESDLVSMVKNIEFRPVRNNFPDKLKNNIKEINNTDAFTSSLKINTRSFIKTDK